MYTADHFMTYYNCQTVDNYHNRKYSKQYDMAKLTFILQFGK